MWAHASVIWHRRSPSEARRDGRKFTVPSIGGSILVNLNDAFDAPLQYGGPAGSEYAQPTAVFIQELTHSWQIHNNSFLGVVCGMDFNYDHFDSRGRIGETAWLKRRWSTFNNKQQVHIVDDWYGEHVLTDAIGNYLFDAKGLPVTDLDGFAASNDSAFRFIGNNIRIGVV